MKNFRVGALIVPVITAMWLLVAVMFLYSQGIKIYERGVDHGAHESVIAINQLLEQAGTRYGVRYTPEDETYHLVIKPRIKR